MISVGEAQARIVDGLMPLKAEPVLLAHALNRVLADDIMSKTTQPPSDVSAMDGYAVRAEDVGALPASLKLIGTVAAGAIFHGEVRSGEAVRIFTGAPVPKGASTIVIQESTTLNGNTVLIAGGVSSAAGRHIRRSGLDFRKGDCLLAKGRKLTSRDIALAAAMNYSSLPCTRQPLVAVLATGDELVAPGSELSATNIVASSSAGISADVTAWGGRVRDLGIACDDSGEIQSKASMAEGCEILITLGGASVGDHDLVQKSLQPKLQVNFWKISMRPGKPLIFGKFGSMPFLGLPGNPVSALVCALLYLKPMIFRLLGASELPWRFVSAKLAISLPENDQRQDYVRCHLQYSQSGEATAHPLSVQDSSMLGAFSSADGLIVRPPLDPRKSANDPVRVLVFAS